MEPQNVILAVGVGLTPLVVMIFLTLRKPRARWAAETQEFILRYGRGLRVFSVGTAAFFSLVTAGFVWAFLTRPDHGGWSTATIVAVPGTLILLCAVLGIEVFRTECRVSDAGIRSYSPWTGKHFLPWSGVEAVRYSTIAERYVVRGSGVKIHLQRLLDGMPQFIEMARGRIPEEKWVRTHRVSAR